jgi:hypothetical protein
VTIAEDKQEGFALLKCIKGGADEGLVLVYGWYQGEGSTTGLLFSSLPHRHSDREPHDCHPGLVLWADVRQRGPNSRPAAACCCSCSEHKRGDDIKGTQAVDSSRQPLCLLAS